MTDDTSTSARSAIAFAIAAAVGFLCWWFSVPLTGRGEPWDGAAVWYLGTLFVLGAALALLLRAGSLAIYLGAYAGQVVYGLVPFVACLGFGALCADQANLFPLGAIMLLVFTLPALIGALFVGQMRALLT